ncbi:MAG: discoidin domain-containing protein [Acidobacteriaceae bacterium]|nr:discoidin domain-containing protein [Acidobacteriaceae bacterium]
MIRTIACAALALAGGVFGLAPTASAADIIVTSPVLTATVSSAGGIKSLTFADGRSWAMGGRSLAGEGDTLAGADRCVPNGDARSTPDGGATWETRCVDSRGQTTLLTEALAPADASLAWTLSVRGAAGTYSKGIWTRLSGWDDPHARLFWTTWPDSGVAGADGWSNPLSAAPFADRSFGFGWDDHHERKVQSTFSVPLAIILEPDTDHALSLVQSPEDVLLKAVIETTAGGDVAFGRCNNRITADKPVVFHMNLVPAKADWRPALGWMTAHYASYFTPVVSNPATEGLGVYSPYPGPFTETHRARLDAEDVRTNWELSLRGPYWSEFMPPVENDEVEWVPDLSKEFVETPDTMSLKTWRQVLRYWDDAGLSNLAYFIVSEFGRDIQSPAPPRQYSCDDPERWRNANDYLYCDFSGAILRGTDGEPVFSYANDVIMDPGDAAYDQHLVDQAQALLSRLPSYAGIAIDRFDEFRFMNTRADDGVTWYDGRPARSLINSWKQLAPGLEATVHGLGKQVWGNSTFNSRVDLYKGLDGVFTENDAASTALNLDAFLGLQRPVIEWVYSPAPGTDPRAYEAELEAVLQRCLYMGVFAMADSPVNGNKNGSGTSPAIVQLYSAYGPMFRALIGKRWVYAAHAVEITSSTGTAAANVFSVAGGVVVPIVEGGTASSADLTLRGLEEMSLDLSQAQLLLPGQSTWQPLPVSGQGSVVTVKVPLSRGAAMVRFRSTQPAQDSSIADPSVDLTVASSAQAASEIAPATVSATLRNNTERRVTGVAAKMDVPDGWSAHTIGAVPDELAAGAAATLRWAVTSSRAAAGTVGEIRVSARFTDGTRIGHASDALRLSAGALLADDSITATATSERPGYPAQAAVDGKDTTFWQSNPATDQSAAITLDLHGSYHLAGLTYLPRQDGDVAGWIYDYLVLVSSDGSTYTPVAQGSWGFDAGLRAASAFDASNVRYVRLVNRPRTCATPTFGQAMSAAKINLVLAPSDAVASGTKPIVPAETPARAALPFEHVVPHSSMTASASSHLSGFPANNAINGNTCTPWMAQPGPPPLYSLEPPPALDESITLDLGRSYDTTGMAYLPRQDSTWGQVILRYEIAVSQDNEKFSVAAEGTWDPTQQEKYAHWPPTAARYVRLKAITAKGGYAIAAAANLEVGYK